MIIVIHVVAMIASLVLMTLAVAMGLAGKRSAATLANIGIIATFVGGLSGIGLLFDSPLSLKCALLTAYLLAVTALHVFGFAMGDADRARLIRATVKNN